MDGHKETRVHLLIEDLELAGRVRVASQSDVVLLVDGPDDAVVVVQGEVAITALKARHPSTPFVVVVPDRDAAVSALAHGAAGALAEDDVDMLLIPAVVAARAGLLVVSPRFSAALESPALTPREKQVLALVVMGFTNAEVASQLVVAESTVKSHLFSAFRRLGVNSRTEAVALITDPSRGLGSGILSIPQE